MAVQRSPKQFSIIEIKPEIESSEEIKAKAQNKEETKHGVKTIPENQRLINIEQKYPCHTERNQESLQNIYETMPEIYKLTEIIQYQEKPEISESHQKIEVETEIICETKADTADDVTELYKQQTQAEQGEVQTGYKQETNAEPADVQNEYKQSRDTESGEVMTGLICEIKAELEDIVPKTEPEEVKTEYIQPEDTELANDRTEAEPGSGTTADESDNVRMRRLVQEVDELVQDCDNLLSDNAKKTENICSKVILNLFFKKIKE